MVKRLSLILCTLVLAAFVGSSTAFGALEGNDAPAIKLPDLDDKEVSLADFKGTVVVLDFWATWCPPCRKSLPHLEKVSKEEGVKVLAVNVQEKKATVDKFIKAGKYTFTVLLDAKGAVSKEYGVSGIPQTVIIGKDGKVKKVFVGFGGDSAAEMDKAIEEAKKEEAKK